MFLVPCSLKFEGSGCVAFHTNLQSLNLKISILKKYIPKKTLVFETKTNFIGKLIGKISGRIQFFHIYLQGTLVTNILIGVL